MQALKPGWRRVKFGEVVRLCRETCKDAVAEGIERYIGLEHIEPGDLRVRSWGDVAEGTTFTNRVRPGQVLFGKRRAYQRKVAVADFDAVCSGDIYVFESANPTRLLPELLPFLCQTDAFFDHAVGTSAGSLSPRTNWSSLAAYELALPPLEEQRRAIRTLGALEHVVICQGEVARSAWQLVEAALLDAQDRSQETATLQDLAKSPVTYGIVKAGDHTLDGVPYVRVADITAGPRLTTTDMLKTSVETSREYSRTILEEGDSVVAVKASRGVVGQVRWIAKNLVGANISRDVARISPCADIPAGYLHWALRMPMFMSGVQARETGWKGDSLREITIGALRTVPVPLLPTSQQAEFAARMFELEAAALLADARVAEQERLSRLALNEVMA